MAFERKRTEMVTRLCSRCSGDAGVTEMMTKYAELRDSAAEHVQAVAVQRMRSPGHCRPLGNTLTLLALAHNHTVTCPS
jgi:hypothetical protein